MCQYLADLVKSFPPNIFLQNLASIQSRAGSMKFAHLAEKSEKGSMSNLSTKPAAEVPTRLQVARGNDRLACKKDTDGIQKSNHVQI